MEQKQTKNKRNDQENGDWKDFVLKFGQNFIKNFLSEIKNNIREKIRQWEIKMKGNIFSGFFLILSVIFFLIGLAKILDYFINLPGVGYLMTGLIMLFISLIVRIYYLDKK